jgi:hypothetical protein
LSGRELLPRSHQRQMPRMDGSEEQKQMLMDVALLIERVNAGQGAWRASRDEWDFLCKVSAATGQTLPDEAATIWRVALGFLGLARSGLEATMEILSGAPNPS